MSSSASPRSLCVGLLFLAAQFWGTMAVPEAEFVRYLQSRMADPTRTNLLSFSYIWYQPLSKEIHDTWAAHAVQYSGRSGVCVADLAAYAAVAIFCRSDPIACRMNCIAASSSPPSSMVSAAYLVMFAIVFDYSRWISNWAVCMFLILHAVKTLPASQDRAADLSG